MATNGWNPHRDPRTGRFTSAAKARVQQVQALADLPDAEWDVDMAACEILAAGMIKAAREGWQPPAELHLTGNALPAPDQTGEVA